MTSTHEPSELTSHVPGRPGAPSVPDTPSVEYRVTRIRRRLERLIGVAATEGNTLTALRNGDEIFAAMLTAIRRAAHTVDMMTFVYWRGDIAREFAEALAERARAGVRVRLLLDGFGSRLIETEQLETMERAGVQVAWFRKPLYLSPLKQNHRCHRKVLVVDEEIAFTGGVGIAQEWCGDARDETEWRDTHVEVRGPAVDGVAAAFAQNWAECHDELFDERDRFIEHRPQGDAIVQVVRGSASIGWQDMQTLIRVMLESAEERFRLATAYFSPDVYFVELLCAAARRGVRVEILLPGPHTDKRVCQLAGQHHYEELIACGVKIYQYQPTMMHAKVITVDGVAALIGSTNFNRRSLDHDEEIMLAVLDDAFTSTLDDHFDADVEVSEPVRAGRWRRRSVVQRAREMAVQPIRRFL
ncbi:phospholipase D-like domain-containing protein [Streptomyces scabiei]|uniref:phospholipase D-like domain-containing protein n=1 Tax=Streptomyces TaxID=1883 RepID=UPI000998DDC9|nr:MULTISPECIES: phospholipase D-like domain-containing protein [Streptomyces]MBP5859501.1 cardiolipin synthase B [Streptomyces sp. LBUM 1484]MBP5871815.1 cardiolipin synthase B [Streptomyces sp. LBUM 1485]MBP5889272.1 cardiolipin synthase B [Streptomyces sp. LBUM 1481]MBP5912159.1 cardiolipin synthase B [Streptomyces sp. LBUM 1486]MBP5919297.1 cardiolipin synthase B [Streptomyces sp. LBUM 1483]QTU58362.1 cardiolipin synthase B [Streptomyces sp. LBUM 1480]